jgi:CDP-glucose 4,6-dehydratase
MRYLITGHTGFKGSWLAAILKMQGHEVVGIALKPELNSHFKAADISRYVDRNYHLDIRDKIEIKNAFKEIQPEVVVHLAAQPLVRKSYKDPVGTYETNVIGTLNVLEATKEVENLQATLIITTDKVYKNKNQLVGYTETDELGGDDPYSSSKAAADIATQSWRKSFGQSPISIARAGNVIGGGDWSQDRIVTDLVDSLSNIKKLVLRNPEAIRPWQHVLDCLNGYLKLIEKQISENIQGEWNFGPASSNFHTVNELTSTFARSWGKELQTEVKTPELPESGILILDSNKSRRELSWSDHLDFHESIGWTVDWYQASNKAAKTEEQIRKFFKI